MAPSKAIEKNLCAFCGTDNWQLTTEMVSKNYSTVQNINRIVNYTSVCSNNKNEGTAGSAGTAQHFHRSSCLSKSKLGHHMYLYQRYCICCIVLYWQSKKIFLKQNGMYKRWTMFSRLSYLTMPKISNIKILVKCQKQYWENISDFF